MVLHYLKQVLDFDIMNASGAALGLTLAIGPVIAVAARPGAFPAGFRVQDITVNGVSPRARRLASASVTRPNVVRGAAPAWRSWSTAGLSALNSPVTWWKL